MQRARRSKHLFLRLSDELLPDIERLLEGEVELVRQTRLLALSILTGREYGISPEELRLLTSLPSDRWVDVADMALGGRPLKEKAARQLAVAGLLVTDDSEQPLATLRERDERLSASGWDPHAALYHAFSKWQNVDVGWLPVASAGTKPKPARRTVPSAFHVHPRVQEAFELPLERPDDDFFRLLLERRTTRGFDPGVPLTSKELAVLLYYTFGCHGYMDLGDVVVLKKTSPSGGSLHPVEAYPLVVDVEGLPPGLYHYRTDRHELELLSRLDREAAQELLVEFAAGQAYLVTARVLLVLTARFERSFWKYRNPRAYAVLHMDAAHLSQTLYLVAAKLGLGAFVSAAVNARNVEDFIGLDGFEEGVLAVCGVGRPAARLSAYDADFEPYVPRETVLEVD